MEAGGNHEKYAMEDLQSKIDISDPAMILFTSVSWSQRVADII